MYGVDKTSLYCFSLLQIAELFTGCYLWPDDGDRVCPHDFLRMVFGGTSWQNRFERISLLAGLGVDADEPARVRQTVSCPG